MIEAAICAACGTTFRKKRSAQTCCGKACKQKLFRKKCNAGQPDTGKAANAAPAPIPDHETAGFTRLYPGLKPLSDIECRVMKIEPTGLRDRRGALLYRNLDGAT
ncbi:hypothetical protein [Aminobacter sp. Piv2-1]|uniref:hypothetical protein n=1 Tax=Aminobacter sp. Piv2-1 TaxID=3031122 RepID=UPI00309E1779